jgi:hypothetical protein
VSEAQAALEEGRHADAFTRARDALAILDQRLLVGVESVWLDEQRQDLEGLTLEALECMAATGRAACTGSAARAARRRAMRPWPSTSPANTASPMSSAKH